MYERESLIKLNFTTYSRVFLEKLRAAQLAKKFLHFTGPGDSLLHSQTRASSQLNPVQTHIIFPDTHLILSFHLRLPLSGYPSLKVKGKVTGYLYVSESDVNYYLSTRQINMLMYG